MLEKIRDQYYLPGMIGGIVQGVTLARIGAAGVRKLGSAAPMQVQDQIHIGSCTKAMTATMLGMLVDNGLLNWSSTIRDVFPEEASRLHPDFQTATLAHLLTHRAGLPHDASWWRLPGLTTTDQRRAALLSLLSKPPLNKPGTVYAYSNAGYVLAGLMAEEVTGQSWEELMQQRLFEPLGMKSAGFGPPGQSSSSRIDQPWGHRDNHGRLEAVQGDNAPCMGPAGTVHCSVPDWGKFASLHLRAAEGKPRLLKPETFRTLHTPPPGSEYAGGWLVLERPWAHGVALNHNGSNTYWYANRSGLHRPSTSRPWSSRTRPAVPPSLPRRRDPGTDQRSIPDEASTNCPTLEDHRTGADTPVSRSMAFHRTWALTGLARAMARFKN